MRDGLVSVVLPLLLHRRGVLLQVLTRERVELVHDIQVQETESPFFVKVPLVVTPLLAVLLFLTMRGVFRELSESVQGGRLWHLHAFQFLQC